MEITSGAYSLTFGSGEKADFAVFAQQNARIDMLGNNNFMTVNAKPGNVGVGVEAQPGSRVMIGNANSSTTINVTK